MPSEILIYDVEEWRQLAGSASRFARVLADETVWIVGDARLG